MSASKLQEESPLVPILLGAETSMVNARAASANDLPSPVTLNSGILQEGTVSQLERSSESKEGSNNPGRVAVVQEVAPSAPESSSVLQPEPISYPKTSTATSSHEIPSPVTQKCGKPMQKPLLDLLDLGAVILSSIALILALLTVSTFAARLQYTNQIIIIAFLLGIMNQCSERIFPYFFIHLEARFGSSTLHGYD